MTPKPTPHETAALDIHSGTAVGDRGLRFYADLAVETSTGEWRVRMPDPEIIGEESDEEGWVWISDEVIAAVLSHYGH